MKRKFLPLFLFLILLSCNPVFAQNKFDVNGTQSAKEFFEKEYRCVWDSLTEEEQFAIACTSNVFERNGQYHLDLSNRLVFDKNTRKGIEVLNENWEIFNYEQLIENYNELTEGEQAAAYLELKDYFKQYPELTPVEIGTREDLNITAVSRMYFVKDKMEVLGFHGLDAWIDSRRISIIRWGIGAGYISEEEGRNLIIPIAKKLKDDYVSFEDFIAHWIAGYCYNAVYSSTCPECAEKLIKAIDTARAYIPFEELKFTGKNADKDHILTIEEAVYTPSAEAARMIPLQKLYKRYRTEEASKDMYTELLEIEKDYPEISDLTVIVHFILMIKYDTVYNRIEYIESKLAYLRTLNPQTETFYYLSDSYLSDLIKTYQPQKVLDYYNSLPQQLQTDEDLYYGYGYAYLLMSNICSTVLERNIYISRARTVFLRLKNNGYNLGEFINSWLKSTESL